MLISFNALTFLGVKPSGVLHVGAHEAEEATNYNRKGWGPTIWVEMLPDKAAALRRRFEGDPSNLVLEAACWDSEADLSVNRAINGQSSSLLEPRQHLAAHPSITFTQEFKVRTTRLDQLLPEGSRFNFLNVDTQGAELRVLRGLGSRIDSVRWALVEVNEVEHYTGCALLADVDGFFAGHGFVRAARIMLGNLGWGDALYVKINELDAKQQRKLLLRSQTYHAWCKIRRPKDTPNWDNWASRESRARK